MKNYLVLVFYCCLLGITQAQSEYFEKGDTGYDVYLEYGKIRTKNLLRSGAVARKTTSLNFGYGWGKKGEYGCWFGPVENDLGDYDFAGNVHVGFNILPMFKNFGIKLESDFLVMENNNFWVNGIRTYGRLGNNNLIIPSVSYHWGSGGAVSEIQLRISLGKGNFNYLIVPSVSNSDLGLLYTIGLGFMSKSIKEVKVLNAIENL